ncbi:MAG: hypothetical protein ACRDTR_13250 [Rubrobacter sp.]
MTGTHLRGRGLAGLVASCALPFLCAWSHLGFAHVVAVQRTRIVTGRLLRFIPFEQIRWGNTAAEFVIVRYAS